MQGRRAVRTLLEAKHCQYIVMMYPQEWLKVQILTIFLFCCYCVLIDLQTWQA